MTLKISLCRRDIADHIRVDEVELIPSQTEGNLSVNSFGMCVIQGVIRWVDGVLGHIRRELNMDAGGQSISNFADFELETGFAPLGVEIIRFDFILIEKNLRSLI